MRPEWRLWQAGGEGGALRASFLRGLLVLEVMRMRVLMVIYLFTMLVEKLGGTSEAVVILLGRQSSSQLQGWHHISATRRARYIGIV